MRDPDFFLRSRLLIACGPFAAFSICGFHPPSWAGPAPRAFLPSAASPAAAADARPGPILSEAMADPAAVPDAQGEFLELGNPYGDTLRLDSLRLDADAQSLLLTGLVLEPGGLFLICRDSLPSANGRMACRRRWSALSLANSRETAVGLAWDGGTSAYALPAPRPGVSWENTWEAETGFRRFLPSAGARPDGDSATPGSRNSRSVRRAARDLGIAEVTWIPGVRAASGEAPQGPGMGEGILQVRVGNRGTGSLPRSGLSLRLDADWDGEAETPVDSVAVEMPASGEALLRISMGAGLRGIVRAALAADENPGNDVFLLPVEPGRPLAITEWLPAPAADEPEWVEIRNRTSDSGGIGRRLELARASFNGLPLGAGAGGLDPGEFLVLTADLDRFRARYGSIKARVLQPPAWKALRNSGDTLTLSLAGF
ncbi:MAG TPA: hypothetical protein VJ385_07710, partial [Fibrobacteria bacterium]|nr:hypothetical protein [Fibrobacteria bacterium]